MVLQVLVSDSNSPNVNPIEFLACKGGNSRRKMKVLLLLFTLFSFSLCADKVLIIASAYNRSDFS